MAEIFPAATGHTLFALSLNRTSDQWESAFDSDVHADAVYCERANTVRRSIFGHAHGHTHSSFEHRCRTDCPPPTHRPSSAPKRASGRRKIDSIKYDVKCSVYTLTLVGWPCIIYANICALGLAACRQWDPTWKVRRIFYVFIYLRTPSKPPPLCQHKFSAHARTRLRCYTHSYK